MKYIIPLFIIIPAIEIGLFIWVGKTWGVLVTMSLIILTGFAGVLLAKKQGLGTLRKIQEEMAYGRPPGNVLLDGICILFGGLLLLSPGFFTDLIGIVLLIPSIRKWMRPHLLNLIKKWFERRHVIYYRR